MNEQALKDAYDLFVQQGYNKSIDDFKQLIASNDNALKDSYNLFTQQGYNQSIDSYKTLLGVSDGLKKKEEPILPMAPQQQEVPSAIPGVQPKKPYTVSPSEDTSSELPSPQTDGTPITPSYVEPTPVQPEQGPLGAFNQKITGPDYGGQITPEEQARAVKIQQPVAPVKEEAPKEEKQGYWSQLVDQGILGINQLDKMVASIPEATYNILAIPQNAIAWATGLDIATSADKLGKDLGIENPILKQLNKEEENLQKKIETFNKDNYQKTGIYENIKDGNYSDAFQLLGSGITQSVPVSLAMMFGGATLSAAELTAAGTLAFSEGSREQLNETAPDMPEIEKTIKSLGMAAAETVFSEIGTGTIGQVYKDIIKKEGIETGKVVFRNGLVEMYKTALKKYGAPIGLLGEGVEEVATQVTQNVISGKPAFEGAADAFITGGGSGVLFSAPITIMNARENIKNIVQTNKSKSEIKIILKDKQSELHEIFNVPQSEPFTPEQIQIANTNKSRDILVKNLQRNVKDGVISKEDAKQSVYIFDKAQQVSNAVKDLNISNEQKTEVANLLSKRNELKTKVENKEDVLAVKEKQEIEQINNQISDIILEPKTEQNAIQEQTADESVLLGKQPQVGLQEVGEGNVQPEVTATGTEKTLTNDEQKRKVELEEALKDPNLENGTVTIGEESIPIEDAQKELVSLKTQPTTIQQELASMETMFGEQITPTVKPTTDQGVSVTNKSSVNDIKAKTIDKERVKVIEAAQRVLKTLKSVLPNFDIVLHNDEGSYNAAMSAFGGAQGTRGNFLDNGDGTGRIDINLSKANSGTVAHEVAHGIMLKAFGDTPALFKGFRDKISKVLNESSNKELMDFAAQYEGDVTYEEYLAELTGRLEQQQDKLSTTTLQRIAAAINEIVSKLTNGTFKPFENIKDTKQVVDFFNNISQSIRKGEEISPADLEAIQEGVSLPIGSPTTISKSQAGEKLSFTKEPLPLSFVTEADKIDINKLIDEIIKKKQKVWFWMADQLGRGNYYDAVIEGEHYLDAGPSFALDPKKRSKGVLWASGLPQKTLQSQIDKSDYIFFVSGSPEKAKLFNRRVLDLVAERINKKSNFNKFKKTLNNFDKETVELNTIKDALKDVNSFEELANSPKRKPFLISISEIGKLKTTPAGSLKELLGSFNAFVDYNELRDGFYKENGFTQNDIMLVGKPTGLGGKAEHSTYESSILGEVVGVPDVKIDSWNIMPQELRDKYKSVIGGKEEKTKPMQTKVIAAETGVVRELKKETKAKSKSQIIGQNSKLTAAVKYNLRFAENMVKDKRSARDIKIETGWEKGIDGKWRYEIPDGEFKKFDIDDLKSESISGENLKVAKLSDIFDAPDLYNYYPDIKDVKVVFKDLPDNNYGSFNIANKVITVNKKLIYTNRVEAESTMIHEIQHYIQTEEVFEPGTNTSVAPLQLEFITNLAKDTLKKIKDQFENVKRFYPENTKAIKEARSLYKFANDKFKKISDLKYHRDIKDIKIKDKEWFESLSENNKKLIGKTTATAYNLYIRNAGEVEARNAQYRKNLTTEQKRKTLLEETENIDREDQILFFHSDVLLTEEVSNMDKKFPVSKSQIDLYHGTPYEIKQFSTEKIGTGEGAQEFGWGLYFTTVKDIAKHYASAISAKQKSDKKFVYDVSIHEGKSPSEYSFLDWNQKVSEDVKNKIRKQAKKEGVLEEYSNKLGLKTSGIENIKNYVKRQFYVNKVIKLRESGISVSEAIKQVASDNNTTEKNIKDIFDLYSFKNIKGDYLYSGLSSELGSDKKASEFLLRAGIDGVKYPTSTISSVGVKSLKGSNYVVFDENAVTIKSVSKSQQDAVNVVNKIIKDARAQGFSEEAIKTFLEGKGMDPKDVSEAMSAELTAAGKVSISEEMLPGYTSLMDKIDALIKNKTPLKDIVSILKNSKEYIKATDVQKEKLIRELRKKLGLKEKGAPSAGKILGEVKDVTKITMTEKQGLVKQIKDLARGAKSAKIAWMNISNLLTKEIKELESSGKVTAKQVSSIIRRFSSVNMFNDKSIEKFVGYMSNVFENAEYANKIDIARSLLTTAKKNIGTKIGIADGLILPLQRLFSINPNLIPESVLDKYLSLVDMFGKKQAVLSLSEKSEVIKTTQDILEAIDEEQSLVDELSDRFNASESKVLDEDGKIDYAASLKEMVKQEEITEEEADIMRKYKSDIVPKAEKTKMTEEEVAEEKKQLIDTLKQTEVNVKDLPTEDERKLAKQLKDLASTKAVEKLSNTELKNLLKVFDNINNNYLPHYAELMAEKLTAINDANSLTSAIKRAVVAPLSGIYSRIKAAIVRSGRTGIAEMVRRNPLFYVDQLFGDFKTKDIFNAVLNKVAEGESKFKSDLKTVQNILERAEERVAKSFGLNSNDTLMSKFKMMTYMVQLEHDSNQGSKQVNPAAEYLKATIKHIDEGKSQFGDRDANMLQQILKDFAPNGEIDNDKLYKSFNEAEKSAIKDIRGINESLKEKAEYTASIIRGDRINPLTNYVHLNVLHEHKPNDLTSGTAFVDDYNNSMKPSTKAKSLIERTGKVSPLNFDVFASAHKGAKFVLMDYNLTAPIRTARKTLKQTISNFEEEGRIPKEKRQIINAIDSAFEEATKNLLTNSFVTNSLADDFVNYINKQGYRAVLAGTSRFASELMSNIGFAVISDPKAFSTGVENKAFIMSADAPTFMKNVKSKETSRLFPTDTLSGKFIDTSILKQTSGISGGKSKNPVRNKIEQIWNLSGKKYVNSVELIADTLISTPDKLVMRPMWFGSFANEFKKITGENINFEKVSVNDESYMSKYNEAIEKAKTTADERAVMTGATDNAFMGILKGTIKPDQSFTTRAFNNFNNFMTKFLIFEYVTARTGLMAAMGNGSLTKKQGAAVLAAVTTRMVVYTLLTQMLGTGLMGLIIGDDEGEEDEKSIMQKLGQALTSAFTSMIFGRDFGQATKAIVNEGLERINENYLDFLREGDYDPYKDAIQYSIVPPEKKGKQRDLFDFFLNMGGAFGPALKTADFVTRKALEPEKQKEDAVERQENERSVRIPLEILGNLGLVPLYKDIRKAVLKDMYSSLETAEKTAANKKVIEQEKLSGYKNQSDMKKYDPELWDKTYGPNSTDYDKEQAIKEIKKAKRNLERETKDEMYNYVPKSKDGFGSKKFGEGTSKKNNSGFGSKKFGPK